MNVPPVLIAGIVALLITYALTPLARRLARFVGAIDHPGGRRVNTRPMPRLGGIAIFTGFTCALIVGMVITRPIELVRASGAVFVRIPLVLRTDQAILGILVGATLVFLVGIWDDMRGLNPAVKFLLQLGAALVLIPFGLSTQFLTHPLTGQTIYVGAVGAVFTILWVVGVVNATNFIDGVDGLAAGIAAISGGTMAVIAAIKGDPTSVLLSGCLIGAVVGFLWHNFHPARIIMGDSGSMFVGYVLGGISVMGLYKSVTAVTLVVPMLALAVPIVDTAFAVLRRWRSRQPIYLPDRGHLHHRLLDRGLSQRQTVLILYLVSAFFGVGALAVAGINRTLALATLAVIALALILGARRMRLLDRRSMPEG